MDRQLLQPPKKPISKKRKFAIILLWCVVAVAIVTYIVVVNMQNQKNEAMYKGAVAYLEEAPFTTDMYSTTYYLSLPKEKGMKDDVTFVDTDRYRLPIVVEIPEKDITYLVWVECYCKDDGNIYSYADIVEID